jgi:hypothetical protein
MTVGIEGFSTSMSFVEEMPEATMKFGATASGKSCLDFALHDFEHGP